MKDVFSARFVLQRNRFAWIDYARGICIILVCYRHCFEGLTHASLETSKFTFFKLMNVSLFSFRMPLFFLVSGIFISTTLLKKDFPTYVKDRFKIILYPMLVWGFIQITLQLLFSDFVNADRKMIDYLNLIIMPRKIEQFWYLNALFVVGVVYAFFKGVMKFNMWQLMITAVLFYATAAIFYQINASTPVDFIAYSFIPDFLHYYIFFFIGDLVSAYILKKENEKYLNSFKILIPVFILFVIAHYFFTIKNLEKGKDYFVEHYLPVLFLFVALTGCAFIIQISFILQKFQKLKFLRVVGYHSLYIYVMHLIVLSAVRNTLVHIFHIRYVPALLLVGVAAGIIIPIFLYNFFVRLGAWWLYSLKKPTDEINYYRNLAIS